MRSFEERIAEIHRRSEKIRKERKKRRLHILTGCVAAVLVTVAALAFLPDTGPQDGPVTQKHYTSYSISAPQIRITGSGMDQTISDATAFLRICQQLDSCTASESNRLLIDESQDIVERTDGEVTDDQTANSVHTDYTITVTEQDGKITEYRLSGNILTNRTTDQSYALTQQQRTELTELLQLPD